MESCEVFLQYIGFSIDKYIFSIFSYEGATLPARRWHRSKACVLLLLITHIMHKIKNSRP